MQKLSTYLYPNRVEVVVDLASYNTEWKIVYQRRVKIYKGLENIIEFDFKNAEQRRVNVNDYSIKCILMEANGLEITTVDVTPDPAKFGIATATIPSTALVNIDPQFLKYAVVIEDNYIGNVITYADTQFNAIGQMELLDGVLPKAQKPKEINTFTFTATGFDSTYTYTSEAVEVKPINNISDNTSITLAFALNELDGIIEVQTATLDVISSGTPWTTLESFSVSSTATATEVTYLEGTHYTNNVTWLRVLYMPLLNNTGKIDKVVVRL